jgi:osmotically-inducible protein OsmY
MTTDAQLKIDVMRALACEVRIDETAIGVSAHHGVVTLSGIVEAWSLKHAAEEAAHRVAGVLDVANEIEIAPGWSAAPSDTDLAEAVRGALTRSRGVPGQQVLSTVSDHGTVTLTGAVATQAQRDEAERVVRAISGVRCVWNQLAVAARA